MGTENELATALRIPVADLRALRAHPRAIPDDMLRRLADVLIERGRGMVRVGEMLHERGGGPTG